jgi:hypothetical protein
MSEFITGLALSYSSPNSHVRVYYWVSSELVPKAMSGLLGLDYLDLYLIHWPYAFQRGDNPFPRNEDQTMQ